MRTPFKKFKDLSVTRKEAIELSKWMLLQAKPFSWQITVMLFIGIVSIGMSFAGTIVGKYIVDATTSGVLNLKYILFMIASTLFSILFSTFTKIFCDYINEKFSFEMKCKMFDRIQRCLWHELSKFHSGDIVTRLTNDVSTVSSGLISIIPSIIITALQLVISFCILFHFDKPLALFALVVGPLGTLSLFLYRKKYVEYQKKLRESESEYRSFMQENLTNINVVKTFQREDYNNERMNNIRKERLKTVMKSSRLGALMSVIMRLVFSSGYVVAFCWGAYRISQGIITYGTMTIFLTLVSQVQGSISSLGSTVTQIYSMIISAKRINEVIEIKEEEYSDEKNIPKNVSVSINDLTFSYNKKNVLENVNMKIESGDIIGVVGSSGIGKTTFIRLLLSLVQPQQGKVEYIDENGNTETAHPSSRRFISYVPQGNTLFAGTIEENLKIGKPDATEEEMWEALRTADAENFVRELPGKLQTVLGEKAGGLSEGQAQRISIARAIIRNKPVLILDEATSALDEKTEARILGTISENCKKTCFIITHRRSMLKYCDKVIEIRDNDDVTLI